MNLIRVSTSQRKRVKKT